MPSAAKTNASGTGEPPVRGNSSSDVEDVVEDEPLGSVVDVPGGFPPGGAGGVQFSLPRTHGGVGGLQT